MKRLLLHSCCAPCSSGVVPQLEDYDITLLFYNPNIDNIQEYNRRLEALERYVALYNQETGNDIKYIAIPYNHEEFTSKVDSTLALEKEGGARCKVCIKSRLDFTAEYASTHGYDIFCSTLSVSPHKNHELINDIGKELSKKYDIEYLENNFKKNNGFLNSIQNSKRYELYRQTYCGCEFAKNM